MTHSNTQLDDGAQLRVLLQTDGFPAGRVWFDAVDLLRLGWDEIAVAALIPERVTPERGTEYHRAQIYAVLEMFHSSRNLHPQPPKRDADSIGSLVRTVQQGSRPRAKSDAEMAAIRLGLAPASPGGGNALRAGADQAPVAPRASEEPLARQAAPETWSAVPSSTVQPAPDEAAPPPRAAPTSQTTERPPPRSALPVHGAYPPDLGPDPRTIKPAAATKAVPAPRAESLPVPVPPSPTPDALPEPAKLLTPVERAREYRRLVDLAEYQQAKTRGQRRRAGDKPVRNKNAREAVIVRSDGRCENPACPTPNHPADLTDAGEPILQVDHVDGLAETFEDRPVSMLALCPNCHAVKTYGRTRHELTVLLRETALRLHGETYAAH